MNTLFFSDLKEVLSYHNESKKKKIEKGKKNGQIS